jgi:hypothetical protein
VNAINALIFSAIGSAMGLLPVLFPSWFPPTGGDASSARALWLEFMSVTQVGFGLGFIVRAHLLPLAGRLISGVPAGDAGALALPSPRIVPGR